MWLSAYAGKLFFEKENLGKERLCEFEPCSPQALLSI